MGEWQIGSLRKCEQREGRPYSIIGIDTPRGRRSSLKSCATMTLVTVELAPAVVTAGQAAGCTSLYQHLCSPQQAHSAQLCPLCPHCCAVHHTTHSPFQAGSRATCGCERLHRGGGRRRGRKGGVKWSELIRMVAGGEGEVMEERSGLKS